MTRTGPTALAIDLLVLLFVALAFTLWAGPPSSFALLENSLLRWMLFSIPWLLVVGRRDLPPIATRREWLALLLIALVGLALRFSLRPLPFHPFNWMNDLVGRVSSEPEPAWFANGYGIFMWPLTLFGVSAERAIFTTNQLAGAATPIALYAAVRSLGGTSEHGLCSALLLAMLPLHARLSASETMQVIPALLVLICVVGFRGHAQQGSRPLLLLGVIAFSYACLTRAETGVVAIALPLFYLRPEDRQRLRDPWLTASVIAALVVAGPLVLDGALPHGVAPVSPLHAGRTFLAAIYYAGPPHPLFAALAAIGLLVMLVQRQWWMFLFVATAFGAQVMLAGFENNPDNRVQLLLAQLPWLMISAGAVPAALLRFLPRTRTWKAAAFGGLLLAVGLVVAPAPAWKPTGTMQTEWLFFDRALPALEASGLTQLVRPQRPDFGPQYIGSFPDYRLPSSIKHWTLTGVLQGQVIPPFAYYRSPDCDGQMLCAYLEGHYRLKPLVTTVVEGREIGLFEVQTGSPPH